VTYHGFVNGTRAALKRMRTRDRGVVIQVGSGLAYRGIPLQAAYCGAKHAIRGFTESVRTELMHAGSNVQLCDVHMPAVNTPQFDWVLHRGIDDHPQPVPPIYQPEVAARAVVHVAEHPKRTTYVGLPTVLTVLGNRVAPWLLDRYLARSNVQAQQNPDKGPPSDTVNLWEPVPGDQGAHGAFDDSAYSRSPAATLGRHRGAAAAAALAVAGTAVAAARRRS
jgi:short-subunit dehydrogenase